MPSPSFGRDDPAHEPRLHLPIPRSHGAPRGHDGDLEPRAGPESRRTGLEHGRHERGGRPRLGRILAHPERESREEDTVEAGDPVRLQSRRATEAGRMLDRTGPVHLAQRVDIGLVGGLSVGPATAPLLIRGLAGDDE